ncbi:hypothetical protein Bint_2706 [Brachyspira intermedia PWS/A]|uniref:Uncharacterized protein n=1 Tax=Brachyspira intermedia (strain ATCC 51140 / PWS/A) TaxID=1045858 RepID=G0EQ42_BRAIP|nr:hypothetical protein Bint_2706 [Brachyspira intermedia PWS/A]
MVFSCAKNNPLNSSNNITIRSYEGTYTGKAKYTVIPSTGTDSIEENVNLIVNKDSTLTFKTQKKMIKIIILQKLKIMQI